ncbi:hypothetical protein [Lacrimispora sp.]|uniref:hypothetical protein n=1 Tax=Lacrimispora sp. TaxID=2719234 RepID=UPI002FD94657
MAETTTCSKYNTYGGIINVDSFNTEHRGFSTLHDITGRILSDMKFDSQCIRNSEERDRRKNINMMKEKDQNA